MSNIKEKLSPITSRMNSAAQEAGKTASWAVEKDENGTYQNFKDTLSDVSKALKSPKIMVLALATTIGSSGLGAYYAHESADENSAKDNKPQRTQRIDRDALRQDRIEPRKSSNKDNKNESATVSTMVKSAAVANSLLLLSVLGTAANRRRVRNELNNSENTPSAE